MMRQQNTDTILMIRPQGFGYNEETAANNSYQQRPDAQSPEEIRKAAIQEFDRFVEVLKAQDVNVRVIEDSLDPAKPDAVFPNNWISFHKGNVVITYPMFSPKRRLERREDIIEELEHSFKIERRYSFEFAEEDGHFLEGTGSMVLDREHRIVYACLSPRTNIKVLDRFCLLMEYEKLVFHAVDEYGDPIYHTNVLMAIGSGFAVICLEAIPDESERKAVRQKLEETDKKIIPISYKQKNAFAGNMLEVKNKMGEKLIVMSETAYRSLEMEQLDALTEFGRIVHSDIPIIEKYGGGSVRCMMAEVFLERKEPDPA